MGQARIFSMPDQVLHLIDKHAILQGRNSTASLSYRAVSARVS